MRIGRAGAADRRPRRLAGGADQDAAAAGGRVPRIRRRVPPAGREFHRHDRAGRRRHAAALRVARLSRAARLRAGRTARSPHRRHRPSRRPRSCGRKPSPIRRAIRQRMSAPPIACCARTARRSGSRPTGGSSHPGTALSLATRDVTSRKRAEEQLARANQRLQLMANHDGLTGLANRRQFDETLDNEFRRARRSGAGLSLLMIDVDCFKAYQRPLRASGRRPLPEGHRAGVEGDRRPARRPGRPLWRRGDRHRPARIRRRTARRRSRERARAAVGALAHPASRKPGGTTVDDQHRRRDDERRRRRSPARTIWCGRPTKLSTAPSRAAAIASAWPKTTEPAQQPA